jgi:hypothetical protein
MGRNAKLINPLSLDRQRLAASFYGRALAIAATEGRGLPSYAHDDVRSAAGWGLCAGAIQDPRRHPSHPTTPRPSPGMDLAERKIRPLVVVTLKATDRDTALVSS